MRIVSLLPSATEIVCALGLEENLVGVTHECDYPPFVKALPKVTRTLIPHDASSADIDALVRERLETTLALYSLDMPVLEDLRPNLLVTQALCDVCAVAEAEVSAAACTLPGLPKVLNLEPMSLEDVFTTLHLVGRATDRDAKAMEVVEGLRRRVRAVQERTQSVLPAERPKVAFVEWIDPIFNGGHWNPTLIEMAGGIDVLGSVGRPSRTTPWEMLVEAQPDVLFIACCGFSRERTLQDIPLLESRKGWGDLPCVRNDRVYVTDGNAYFSRPGPRLVDSLEIMAHALHPNVHPLPDGLPAATRLT
ncbi:MAG: ABC-type Fe3+-hydroxamate transport system,periplasmic component [Chthonomonadaceae bacterium]|nr:ABC-type Fe3+-hydroxamate transport system,periplasmic component [Chthonomonadaceae bacterium]